MIFNLDSLKIGSKVHYQPSHYRKTEWENGIVKEIPEDANTPGSDQYNSIRVVFLQNNDWDNYKDYASALTSLRDLHLDWRTE